MTEVKIDWWKGGVIYQIYPRSFQDTTGDGYYRASAAISTLIGDARLRAAGVIEEEMIPLLHLAQEVTRLIVAHAIPAAVAQFFQVLDGKLIGFGLH